MCLKDKTTSFFFIVFFNYNFLLNFVAYIRIYK